MWWQAWNSIVGKPPRKDATRLTCRPTAAYLLAESRTNSQKLAVLGPLEEKKLFVDPLLMEKSNFDSRSLLSSSSNVDFESQKSAF